ncbi:MAG: hypothetical protein ABJZ55_08505 [Fuerstiella sp.]
MRTLQRTATRLALVIFTVISCQSLVLDRSAYAEEPTQEDLAKLVTEKDLVAVLKMPCAKRVIPGETNLQLILKDVSKAMSVSLGKPVVFFRDIAELEFQNVDSLEDIFVWDLYIPAKSMSYADQLKLILETTADPRLSYDISHGCFLITTREKVAATLRTKIYDLDHLLVNADLASNEGKGTLTKDRGATVLQRIVERNLCRISNLDHEQQLIEFHGQYLVLITNRRGHAMTTDLLSRLSDAIKEGGPPKITTTSTHSQH